MSERSAVQEPLLQYAQHIGWDYVPPEEAVGLRGGISGLYFSDVVETQLQRLNPEVVTAENAKEVLRKLSLLRPSIEGNRDAMGWLRGQMAIFDTKENRERNVRLLDFERPESNVFQVTEEWTQQGAVFRNRADVVFLINGLPVAIAETKSASRRDGLSEGVGQIRRYHRETPEMLVSTQVFEVTELFNFYYGATWNTAKKNIFNWKDEQEGDYERKVKEFFRHGRFLKVLRDYVVFLNKDDELQKLILRQHQTRAVEKVVERALDPQRRRGLIWHTQGSGKTLTMITIASKLLREKHGEERPTVLMIVDRNELEAQLFRNLESYGISNVEVAQSKRDLKGIMHTDYRGLIVSMIHKFDGLDANMSTRENIIVLVDEAHRTTSGDLGNYLIGALPNATYIGFTGTPIDRIQRGKGTFKVFGGDDEQGYLDKYSIAESIVDGTTVRLNYSLAPSDLLVEKEKLEKEFMSLAQAEGLTDIEELNEILDSAVVLKEAMKSPDRMEKIAKYVAKHFQENVEPMGFKAFLVAVDREACALYKKLLDKYLPAEYSVPVYSPSHNDSELLRELQITEYDEKEVRKAFIAKGRLPKILIVTEKLLTGFDAPILYCMYLDKPMRDHVLLQAIARVNRPYEDETEKTKPCGFVLDFVGIFDNLEKALAFDSDVVQSVIQNIEVLESLFANQMAGAGAEYLRLTPLETDKQIEVAVDHFADKTVRDEFFQWFKQLEGLYEILSPSAFLRKYLKDYLRLAELFRIVKNAYSADSRGADRELTAKTKALLREHSRSNKLGLPGAIYQLGPAELAKIKEDGASDNVKVLNLRKVLAGKVEQEGGRHPYLVSIAERAEAIALAYEDRQVTTQQALDGFERLAREVVSADEERQRLKLNENAFAIFKGISAAKPGMSPELAAAVDETFKGNPDYEWNAQQEAELRTSLYAKLQGEFEPDKLVDIVDSLMRLKRV